MSHLLCAPALVALIMPLSGMTEAKHPDEVGAALCEICAALYSTKDETARENLFMETATLIFARTNTHDREAGEFWNRRLIFTPPA
jgi:hypothetical protein